MQHSPAHLLTPCPGSFPTTIEWLLQRPQDPQRLRYLLPGPLYKKLAHSNLSNLMIYTFSFYRRSREDLSFVPEAIAMTHQCSHFKMLICLFQSTVLFHRPGTKVFMTHLKQIYIDYPLRAKHWSSKDERMGKNVQKSECKCERHLPCVPCPMWTFWSIVTRAPRVRDGG